MFAQIDFSIIDTVSNTTSQAIEVPAWATRAQLFVPTIATAVMSMQMIEARNVTAAKIVADQSTDWKTVRSEDESSTILASGEGNTWIDITEFVRSLPPESYIRFVSNADQTVDRALIIVFRG